MAEIPVVRLCARCGAELLTDLPTIRCANGHALAAPRTVLAMRASAGRGGISFAITEESGGETEQPDSDE